jgi:hypothetical protein
MKPEVKYIRVVISASLLPQLLQEGDFVRCIKGIPRDSRLIYISENKPSRAFDFIFETSEGQSLPDGGLITSLTPFNLIFEKLYTRKFGEL